MEFKRQYSSNFSVIAMQVYFFGEILIVLSSNVLMLLPVFVSKATRNSFCRFLEVLRAIQNCEYLTQYPNAAMYFGVEQLFFQVVFYECLQK